MRIHMGKKILVLNGPNLNLLGQRDPGVYGTVTLAQVNQTLQEQAKLWGATCDTFQSNHEGDLIDQIQGARGMYDGIILNAGALTHYSYALHDAIQDTPVPVIEVHISNIYARDAFRAQSVLSPVCQGTIAGFGTQGYTLALYALVHREGESTT